MSGPGYLRYPSVRGDLLAFVADDDVWLVASGGGVARRITADHKPAADCRLSPDRSHVAYTSWREGAPEAVLVPTDGGEVRRLSYFGDDFTRVIGWDGDGRVLVVSAAGEPFRGRTWAYAIDRAGGQPQRLPYGPITALARSDDGAVVLGVNQSRRRGAAWKRYRGGTAASLWIDRRGDGTFTRFLREIAGQLEDPHVAGERVVFVSDHEGYGNLYSVLLEGSDLRRHSDHADFYARNASADGSQVVYQCAGTLYRLLSLSRDAEPEPLEVELGSPRSGRARRPLRAEDELGELACDERGRASAVVARGELHWLTHRQGPARLLAGGGGSRARLPCLAGRGEAARVLCVSDAEGEDCLEVVSPTASPTEPPRRLATGELGRVLELVGSPDGALAAVASHDGRLLLVDLTAGSVRTLDQSSYGDVSGLAFSPDSTWLAWSHPGPSPLRQIKLARVDSGELAEVTALRFHDSDPVFTLDGKYLAFISVRTFDPVYDSLVFDLSFIGAARPYLVPLAAGTPSPFDPELAGRPRQAKERHPSTDQPAVAEVVIDLDGLGERVVPLPVPARRYSHLAAARDGLLFLEESPSGVLGEDRQRLGADAPRPRLQRFDLVSSSQLELAGALDDYAVSGDGTVVVVRDRKSLRVLPADRKVEPPAAGEEPDAADLIEVDLSRMRIELDPPVEWRQMYDEAARLMRDHYFVADMSGVDWPGVVARYRPLLERIATRDDLSELLWEVQGELGTSHAYERPPAPPAEEERRLGLLGADLERGEEGEWRIGAPLAGDSSVLAARSPLRAPATGLRAGDAILAVDGRPVDPVLGPSPLLVGAAGKPVELTVRRGGDTRQVVVEPLADERPIRYHAWVAERRAFVHERSGGRAGYVHLPDMMGGGWAELHRDLRLELQREALVIDVRDNGGGHVSELVLEKISRLVYGWDLPRHLQPLTYPSNAPRGPRVLVVNEIAGSDGDIVTAGFRQRAIGPIVGLRTWGGVVGIDGRYELVDGTSVTQPRYAFYFEGGVGWSIENHGVEPDIEVDRAPQDWAAGADPQLERGVAVVLELLADHPAATPPDPSTRPSRVPPPLPPRP